MKDRLDSLRNYMQSVGLSALIIPSNDPHQSEYVADYWKGREWLTGFTGSSGTAIVTMDHAGLWTDSRYFIQAEKELQFSPFELHRIKTNGQKEYLQWIATNLQAGAIVGIDGNLFTLKSADYIEEALEQKELKLSIQSDFLTDVWQNRPELPKMPVFMMPNELCSQTRTEKIEMLRIRLHELKAHYLLLTDLDEIAWTLNIRGKDIECNTSVISYLLIGLQSTILFIDSDKILPKDLVTFERDGISNRDYHDLIKFVKASTREEKSFVLDKATCNVLLYQLVGDRYATLSESMPSRIKAIKTDLELNHIRKTMVYDGVALVKSFRWLENELSLNNSVTEYDFSQQMSAFRSEQPGFWSDSFYAIVGYAENGAIVHYRPDKAGSKKIEPKGILLVDSGGHYQTGTTDITRTISLGDPSVEERRNFTLVLKGNIALDQAVFPKGTKGIQLDILARQYLWKEGLLYQHGTGHGVGFFSNVHEKPHGIAPGSAARGSAVFEAGVVVTNEPGLYFEGRYGIRIENMMETVKKKTTEFGEFLGFETLTWFPIDQNLLDESILTRSEIMWLDAYHEKVRINLMPHLDTEEKFWLMAKTRSLARK